VKKKILPISLKLNFTPNTLGCKGLNRCFLMLSNIRSCNLKLCLDFLGETVPNFGNSRRTIKGPFFMCKGFQRRVGRATMVWRLFSQSSGEGPLGDRWEIFRTLSLLILHRTRRAGRPRCLGGGGALGRSLAPGAAPLALSPEFCLMRVFKRKEPNELFSPFLHRLYERLSQSFLFTDQQGFQGVKNIYFKVNP